MSRKSEGTMHTIQLGLLAALAVLGMAHASTIEHVEAMAESTTVVTTTTSMTRTVTLTRLIAASPAPDEMTVGGKEYQLQGCFGQGAIKTMAMVLGTDCIAPEGAAGSSNMTLSLCLKLCGSAVTLANESYPYIGVSRGDSCYCGTALDATAPNAPAHNCTLPCRGNNTEACGGTEYMSVYKLVASRATTQSKFTGGGDTFSNDNNDKASHGASSGVAAGIAVGSISGFGIVLFLIVLGTRWCTRRRQAQAVGGMQRRRKMATSTSTTSADTTRAASSGTDSTDSTTTTTTTSTQHEKAVLRDATRMSLRRLDGVVMDKHASPRIRGVAAATTATTATAAAATTGAQWRNSGSSPLTPRTPRHADGTTGMEMGVFLPTTPSIRVHPPDTIAPTHGLGERAWHRRRLSIPFPPARSDGSADDDDDDDDDGGKRETRDDDRNALPSQRLAATSAARDRTVRQESVEVVSALTEDGPASSPSWRWTLSTESGDSARDDEDEKAGRLV